MLLNQIPKKKKGSCQSNPTNSTKLVSEKKKNAISKKVSSIQVDSNQKSQYHIQIQFYQESN